MPKTAATVASAMHSTTPTNRATADHADPNETAQLRYLVLATQREGNRQLAQALRPLGLTPAQAEVVSVLAVHEPLTLTALGRYIVCETGSTSAAEDSSESWRCGARLQKRERDDHLQRRRRPRGACRGGRTCGSRAGSSPRSVPCLDDFGRHRDLPNPRSW